MKLQRRTLAISVALAFGILSATAQAQVTLNVIRKREAQLAAAR